MIIEKSCTPLVQTATLLTKREILCMYSAKMKFLSIEVSFCDTKCHKTKQSRIKMKLRVVCDAKITA